MGEEIVPAESVVLEGTDYNISLVENPANTITTTIQTVVETMEVPAAAVSPPPLPSNNVPPDAKFFYGSVRSGQQVSADQPYQSLVVVGNVNSGGEVMTKANVYVFGRLKGRALAGLAMTKSSGGGGDC